MSWEKSRGWALTKKTLDKMEKGELVENIFEMYVKNDLDHGIVDLEIVCVVDFFQESCRFVDVYIYLERKK